jgi:uncharacterized protein YdeI (YjbR/CyaY-like superfamily)
VGYPRSRMRPKFFESSAAFRDWLERNHGARSEILVGFYKKGSGRPSMSWPESVDEALCFGWIDGVRRRIDEESYSIRFTPRKRRSVWSAVNIRRAAQLRRLGRMHSAGERAFDARREEASRLYSYERARAVLDPAFEKRFRANREAWNHFDEQPPGYRRLAIHWVMSAKKEETRLRRLSTLIEDSEGGRRLRVYTLEPKRK